MNDNYLVRGAWCASAVLAVACGGGRSDPARPAPPAATAPLPTMGLGGQRVMVLPLTLLVADEGLLWQDRLGPRTVALALADSIVGAMLMERAPEVTWVLPAELRRAARMSAGMAGDPAQFATASLRFPAVTEIPDPLRTQVRNLAAVSRARFGLVPAALVWVASDTAAATRALVNGTGPGTAHLTLAIVDTRLGQVAFRTVARGAGDDPWTALSRAVKAATPGLP